MNNKRRKIPMQNRKLMSEFYRDGGGVAKVYQVVNNLDDRNNFYSITYKDASGTRTGTEDFPYKSLQYVNDVAEDWALQVPVESSKLNKYQLLAECIRSDQLSAEQVQSEMTDPDFKNWYKNKYNV